MKGHFIGMFAQDKWKLNNNLTLNLGARYDIELLRTPNGDNPLFTDDPSDYPEGLEQHRSPPRLHVGARQRRTLGRARRLRRVLPADVVHVPDQHVLERRGSPTRSRSRFPMLNVRSGSAAGQLPDRSAAGERAERESRAHRRAVPAGDANPQHRHGPLRQPRSQISRIRGSTASGTSASWDRPSGSASISSAPNSASSTSSWTSIRRPGPTGSRPAPSRGTHRSSAPRASSRRASTRSRTSATSTTTRFRCRGRSGSAMAGRRGSRTRSRAAAATRRPARRIPRTPSCSATSTRTWSTGRRRSIGRTS